MPDSRGWVRTLEDLNAAEAEIESELQELDGTALNSERLSIWIRLADVRKGQALLLAPIAAETVAFNKADVLKVLNAERATSLRRTSGSDRDDIDMFGLDIAIRLIEEMPS